MPSQAQQSSFVTCRCPDDVVGRFAGDEFVLLIYGEATSGELQDLVARVRRELGSPMSADATSGAIHAGIGVVDVHQDDQRTAKGILFDADRAMYEAKRAHRRRGRQSGLCAISLVPRR